MATDQTPSIEEIPAERLEAIRAGIARLDRRGDECLMQNEVWVIYGRHWPEDLRALLAEHDAFRSRVEADERRIKELEARVKDLKPRARQVTAETSDGFGPRPDLERVFCLNHFSFRRDEEEPPICEKAFANGLYPCEFR